MLRRKGIDVTYIERPCILATTRGIARMWFDDATSIRWSSIRGQPAHRPRATRVLALIAAATLGASWAQSVVAFAGELPRTELEALVLAQEHAIDPAVWELVQPYYRDPLIVPAGELRLLSGLPIELPEHLPTSAAELDGFRPWDHDQTERFYRTYPELRALAPILSFQSSTVPHWGAASVRVSGATGDHPSASTRLDVRVGRVVDGQGTARFDQTQARWARRTVSATIPEVGRFQVGNFDAPSGVGMTLGYFAPAPQDESQADPVRTWLAGGASAWNGVAWSKRWGSCATTGAFYHRRTDESCMGVVAGVRARAGLGLDLGVSAVTSPDTASAALSDTALGLDIGASYRRGAWNAGVRTALNSESRYTAPIEVTLRHRGEQTRLAVRAVHIPAAFPGEHSRTAHELASRLDGIAGHSMTGLDISVAHTVWRTVSAGAGLSYTFAESQYALDASAQVSVTHPLELLLRYGYRPPGSCTGQRRRVMLDASAQPTPRLGLALSSSVLAQDSSYARVNGRISADWRALPSLTVTPYAAACVNTRNVRMWSVGIEQALDIFEKTRVQAVVEVPLESPWDAQRARVDAGACFFF